MAWWWPFGSSSNSTRGSGAQQAPPLDTDLQEYYSSVLAEERQHEAAAAEAAARAAAAADGAADQNIARVRPVSDPRSSEKTLKQIAMDNCVEFERAYSTCLLRGSYAERLGGCPTQLSMYEQCQAMQADALAVLGFARAQSDAEKRAIKARADDLMIAAAPGLVITAAQADTFTKALDSLRAPDSPDSPRGPGAQGSG